MERKQLLPGKFTTTDLIYIAGFFDGEGCIRIGKAYELTNRTYYYNLSVTIGNTDLDVLKYIHGVLGGALTKRAITKNRKDFYGIYWSGKWAKNILLLLLPYLRTKHKQAELGIYFEDFVHVKGSRASGIDKDLQEIFFQISKSLKCQLT